MKEYDVYAEMREARRQRELTGDCFANRLRGAMIAQRVTVHSLCVESGFSEKYITDLRNGHKTNPTIFAVRCLAHVLNVTPSYLAGWSE